jgi:hypothetical protein
MRMAPRTLLGIAVGVVLAASPRHVAADTARQILDRQRTLEEGERHWTDRRAEVEMEVHDPQRPTRRMALQLLEQRAADRTQRMLVYFIAPDAVKGTAFLAVARPGRLADQWLYLPAAKRARRIGGELRNEGFVGTDFTYRDLDLLSALPTWTEADGTALLRTTEALDGVPCAVIELTPTRAGVGYARIVVWLGRDDLVARQLELFEAVPSAGWFELGNRADQAPARRIRQSDVRAVGRIPVPHRMDVETPSARTTTVTLRDVAFDTGLPDELFTQPALDRGGYASGR